MANQAPPPPVFWVLVALAWAGCEDTADVCAAESPFAKAEEGATCPNGAHECEAGLGCHDGVCGACTSGDDCSGLDGCHEGECGACTADDECGGGASCRDGFCMPTAVEAWNLTIAEADWSSLLASAWEDTEYPCELAAAGTSRTCIVRAYGETSRKYPKKSLRVEVEDAASSPGFSRKMSLRAEYNDPTFMRTVVGYETLRRLTQLPVPRTAYRALSVNGAYYGLMVEVERLNDSMLERWGRDPSVLYKADHAAPFGALVPMPASNGYALWEDDDLYAKAEGDEDDYSDLASLIEDVLWLDYEDSLATASTVVTRTDAAIDLQPHLDYLAVMTLLQNRDHVAANFYLSPQPTADGRTLWELYPYDVDISFGCVYDSEEHNNVCDVLVDDGWPRNGTIPSDAAVGYPNELWANMLIHLLLNNHSCERRYYRQIEAYMDGEWWNDRVPLLMAAIERTIGAEVEADPNDLNATLDEHLARVDDMMAFVGRRRAWLRECLYGTCP